MKWGDFRHFAPFDAYSGGRRGLPVDRHYIEQFLAQWRTDVRGDVLETGNSEYTRLFGGKRVRRSHVLNAVPGNHNATLVGDLTDPQLLEPHSLDCIILTQTLQYVFDLGSALRNCATALRPGGTLLVTVPTMTKMSGPDVVATGEYWRFTSADVERLLTGAFGSDAVTVEAFGNLIAATAFLHGLAAEELETEELERRDPDYEMLIAARAVRK